MKNVRLIISATVLVGIAGCSTPTPKSASSHQSDSPTAATVEDGRQLYEVGKIYAAERKLLDVLAVEPNNRKALYYLTLIKEAQEHQRRYENLSLAEEQSRRRPKPWGFYPTYPLKLISQ